MSDRVAGPESLSISQRRNITLLLAMAVTMAVSSGIFGIISAVFAALSLVPLECPIIALACPVGYLISYWFARRGWTRTGNHLFCSTLIVVVIWLNVLFGVGNSTIAGYAVAAVSAGLLSGAVMSLVYGLAGAAAYVSIGVLQAAGAIEVFSGPQVTFVIDGIAVAFVLATIALLLGFNQRETKVQLSRELVLAAERTRAELSARESEANYKRLFDRVPVGMYRTSPDGKILDANPALAGVLGAEDPRVLLQHSVRDFYALPEQRELELERLEEEEVVMGEQLKLRRLQGDEIWVQDNARAVRDEAGRVVWYEGILEDITERRRYAEQQQAIREIAQAALSATNLSDLYASIHRVIAGLMPAENFVIARYHPDADRFSFPYWVDEKDPHPLASAATGKGLTALVVRTGEPQLVTSEDAAQLQSEGTVDALGTPASEWMGIPLKVGSRVIGAIVVQTYDSESRHYDEGDLLLLTVVSTQIASAIERTGAVEAMQVSEQRYRSLFENAIDLVYETDLDGRFTVVNRAAEPVLGDPPESVVGTSWAELVVSGSTHMATPLSWSEGSIREQVAIRGRDGRTRHLENSAWQRLRGVEVIGIAGIARDVSDRVELEEQLRHSQKMEAVGRIAGSLAHDFNNLLAAINGHAELATSSIDTSSPAHADLMNVQRTVRDAASLTNRLLTFSRREDTRPVVLDLNVELLGMESMLRRLAGEDIRIQTQTHSAPLPVLMDRAEMSQIVLNLVTNARDAMLNGGTVTIELSRLSSTAGSKAYDGSTRSSASLTVRDDGTGIDPDLIDRIFEPFVTTKPPGKGTGLGLSTVYRIVEQAGGTV